MTTTVLPPPVDRPADAPASPALSPSLRDAYAAALADTDVRMRELTSGHRVIERGDGPAAILIHGTRDPSPLWLPLLTACDGVRLIAADRPQARSGDDVVGWLDDLLDALGLESASVVGHSAGGLWGLTYALARPGRVDHLVMIGSPALPGCTVPLPYRVVATPGLGRLVVRLRATTKAVRHFATMMGEGESIQRYPALIDLLVAVGNDRAAAGAGRDEARQLIAGTALLRRQAFRHIVAGSALRAVRVPTTVVWGTHDPVGTVAAAATVTDMIPHAQLEVFDAGHVPWLAHPNDMAALVARIAAGAPSASEPDEPDHDPRTIEVDTRPTDPTDTTAGGIQ